MSFKRLTEIAPFNLNGLVYLAKKDTSYFALELFSGELLREIGVNQLNSSEKEIYLGKTGNLIILYDIYFNRIYFEYLR